VSDFKCLKGDQFLKQAIFMDCLYLVSIFTLELDASLLLTFGS
jgi:hypothetical protein